MDRQGQLSESQTKYKTKNKKQKKAQSTLGFLASLLIPLLFVPVFNGCHLHQKHHPHLDQRRHVCHFRVEHK